MKQTAIVKDYRIGPVPMLVPMSIVNAFDLIPSKTTRTNLTFKAFVSIEEQMRARGEKQNLSFGSVLDEVLKDHERAWKTLGNL